MIGRREQLLAFYDYFLLFALRFFPLLVARLSSDLMSSLPSSFPSSDRTSSSSASSSLSSISLAGFCTSSASSMLSSVPPSTCGGVASSLRPLSIPSPPSTCSFCTFCLISCMRLVTSLSTPFQAPHPPHFHLPTSFKLLTPGGAWPFTKRQFVQISTILFF